MSAAAIGGRVQAAAAARAFEAEGEYWEKVRACARPGAEPDPDEVAAWLLDRGRDPGQFQQDLDLVAARFEDAAKVAALPAAAGRRAKLQAELDAAREAYQKAADRWDAVVKRIAPQMEELDKEEVQAQLARGRLARSCPYRHLAARAEALGREVRELAERRDVLQRDARHEALGNAAKCEQAAERSRSDQQKEQLRAEAEGFRRQAEVHAAEAAVLDRRLHDLHREQDALAAQLQEP